MQSKIALFAFSFLITEPIENSVVHYFIGKTFNTLSTYKYYRIIDFRLDLLIFRTAFSSTKDNIAHSAQTTPASTHPNYATLSHLPPAIYLTGKDLHQWCFNLCGPKAYKDLSSKLQFLILCSVHNDVR